jgi:drug/metabolite transporter (DMT)-like permease
MPPLTYATLRVLGGLITVVVLQAARGKLRLPPRSDVSVVFSWGLVQVAGGVLIMNLALKAVSAGRASVLAYTMPLFVAVILAVWLRTRPKRGELIGLALGLGGLVLLLNPAVIDWGRAAVVLGVGALLLHAASWGALTIQIRRHHWTATPLDVQPWQLLVALVPVALIAYLVEGFQGVNWQASTVLVLLYSGPLATAFAAWASQSVTRALGAQATAIGFVVVPVVGLIAGNVLLGEALGPIDGLGFVLVLAGVAIASLRPDGWRRQGARTA